MGNTKILSKNPLCFVPKTIKNLDRIDCSWSNPEVSGLLKKLGSIALKPGYTNEPLGRIAEVKGGKRLPKGTLYPETDFATIPYVRVTNIENNKINLSNCAYISEILHETIKQYQLKRRNIVISIAGTIGEVGMLEQKIDKCNFNENMAKIVVRDEKQIYPYYLCYFLDSLLGKRQIERLTVGALQYKLSLSSVRSIKIVYPESLDTQKQIVAEIQKYEDKARENLQEYREIIEEIKNVAPKKLNIDLKGLGEDKIFGLEPEEIKDTGSRIDCYCHSSGYKNLIHILKKTEKGEAKYKLVKGDELNISIDKIDKKEFDENRAKEFKYIEVKHTEKDIGLITGYLEDILLNLPGRARQKIKRNNVIIPRPIGSTEAIAIVTEEFDKDLCSTGFIAIRARDFNEAVLLWAILKSDLVQKQFFHLQSGSLQPEITPKNFKEKVLVPIPTPQIQEEIVKETQEKLEMAKQLKREYEENIRRGKEVFLECLTEGGKDKL